METIKKLLKVINKGGLYPEIMTVIDDNSEDPVFTMKGSRVLTFNSCNYLGLSAHPEIKKIVANSILKYGIHPSNSPLVGGLWKIHEKFEKELAIFFGYDDCILFSSTTAVNTGVIPAITNLPVESFLFFVKLYVGNTKTTIFSDELNHATIVDGCRISKNDTVIYNHLDLQDLENKLKQGRTKRNLIVTDGVFSMDGHIINLPAMVKLSRKYNCLLAVDDAHSIGVLGKHGKGIMEFYNLNEGVDIYIASLSKGFGMIGGCVCAKKEIIDFLKVTARTYIFSRTYLTSIAEGGLKILEILNSVEGQQRIAKLWDNTNYLIQKLNQIGYNTLETKTPLIPMLIGNESVAIKFSNDLFNLGIYVPPMRWPAVPKGMARLRYIITSLHERKHIDYLLECVEKLGKKYKILK
ncbi:MAG: aminotransferase class I/II-fold pyridoxal phosphate-dependent enzyme [Patescibacteria group bacterium]|jgi:8-amino-7-oxononanoate synthase